MPTLSELAAHICRGGWPSFIQLKENASTLPLLERYFMGLFTNTVNSLDKSPRLCKEVAYALTRTDTTSASVATIAADAGDEEAPISRHIAQTYLDLLKQNYFFYELPAWDAPVKSKTRRRKKPKRYIEDPSLTAALLNVNAEKLLKDQQFFGILFESFAVHDLSVYAQALPNAGWHPLYYYQASDGLEVDVVIELLDGRWGAIEVKLGTSKVDAAAAQLMRFAKRAGDNSLARAREPEFLAVVVGFSDYAYRREQDGIYVLPLTALTV